MTAADLFQPVDPEAVDFREIAYVPARRQPGPLVVATVTIAGQPGEVVPIYTSLAALLSVHGDDAYWYGLDPEQLQQLLSGLEGTFVVDPVAGQGAEQVGPDPAVARFSLMGQP